MRGSDWEAGRPPTDKNNDPAYIPEKQGEISIPETAYNVQGEVGPSGNPDEQDHTKSDCQSNRRGFLMSASVVIAGGLAGCIDTGGSGESSPADEGGDDGEDGSPVNENGEDNGGGDDSTDAPTFGEAVELQDQYAFEITAHYQNLELSGRQHQDDHYHDIQLSGTHVEEYYVDGTAYVVTEGMCVTNPNASNDPTSDLNLQMVSRDMFQAAVSGNPDVRPGGTTTIDGETVYIYEVTTDGVQSVYYVNAETNIIHRVEMNAPEGDITVEFHSWGDVEPVEPPDCAVETADETTSSDTTDTPEEAVDGPAFGEAIELQDEYAFEITAHYQNLELSGRQHQDDHYHDIQLSGTRVEDYYVDGTAYVVTEGVCVINPSPSDDPTSDLDLEIVRPDSFQTAVSENPDVLPRGTTTIDGETVYIYEVTTNEVQSVYYVNAETNLLRRVEINAPDGDITVEFHSWGDVDPIEPPDGCY